MNRPRIIRSILPGFIAILLVGCAGAGADKVSSRSIGDPGEDDTLGPPGEVVSFQSSSDCTEVSIRWFNPSCSDFSHCEVSWTPSGGEAQPKVVTGSPGQEAGTTITGLESNTSYSVSVRAVDTEDNEGNAVTLAVQTRGMWRLLGNAGFSAGDTLFLDLAFDSQGTPYASYQDRANGSKATVMRLNGDTWEPAGSPAFSDGVTYRNNVVVDSAGTPLFAFHDNTNGGPSVVRLVNGEWSYVGDKGFVPSIIGSADMAIDTGNRPYVVFQEATTERQASVMRFSSGVWHYPVDSQAISVGRGNSTCIEVTPTGVPYIAFLDENREYRVSVMKLIEQNFIGWLYIGSPGFSNPAAIETSSLDIAVRGYSTPYVAFQDGGQDKRMSVMTFDGTEWQYVGSPGITAGTVEKIHLAFDSQEEYLYAACLDHGRSPGVVVYRYAEAEGWICLNTDGVSTAGSYDLGFALDNQDRPHLLFKDSSQQGRVSVIRYD